MKHFLLTFSVLAFCLSVRPAAAEDTSQIDFVTQIRPLLSNKCFHCHGPDEAERQGDLRLDTASGAFGETASGLPAITPGDVDDSELFRRITSEDDSERMPPAGSGMELDEKSIALIRKWIEQGAEYKGHWSYQKPERPELPAVQNADWPINEIDRFVLARLEKEGLQPQSEADKAALLRRVTLDLTGLPPTLEEAEEFLNDPSPQAYERVVDRLLDTPTYGEHWARMWLDLARYADSAGYADDPSRTIWLYRDYVIRSLNANKPFDEFTIEQLAGDLLPNPTEDQLIATAFHRNTMTNNEGGTNDEEFRNAAIVDRVNTTFAVWMGTTMACAQCHTHKFDPISHQEYFELFAIFNNTEDADKRDESPLLEWYSEETKQKKASWQAEIAELKKTLSTPTDALKAEMAEWEARLQTPLEWTDPNVLKLTGAKDVDIAEDKTISVPESGDRSTYQIELQPNDNGQPLHAVQLQSLPEDGGAGHAGGGNFVITSVSAAVVPDEGTAVPGRFVRIELPGKKQILSLAEVQVFSAGRNLGPEGKATQSTTSYNAPASYGVDGNTDGNFDNKSVTHTETADNPWWEVDLGSLQPIDQIVVWNRTDNNLQSRLKNFRVSILDADRKTVWEQKEAKPPQDSTTFAASSSRPVTFSQAFADYEQQGFPASHVLDVDTKEKTGWAVGGQTAEPHTLTLTAEKPFTIGAGEKLVITIDQQSKYDKHTLKRFRIATTGDNRAAELARVPDKLRTILQQPSTDRTPAAQQELTAFYVKEIAPSLQKSRERLASLETSLEKLKPTTTVPVMRQLPADQQRKTHIQIRGNFMVHGDEVSPGLPEVFEIPLEIDQPTRLDLAHWLVHPDNPLTPRVIANRYWEKLFGLGLVSTSEEFGSQGELPTHPALLDWLATELLRLDWDLKAFVKTIVMSAAYRQAGAVTPELLEVDPDNRLMTRGPRVRLSAEMIRDQALSISGLLSSKMYGPPVKPPQPDIGLKAAFGAGIDWVTSKGEDRYRRGLYTTWRRSNPYPSMAAFDAPNREVCTVRRDRTNTPLQAFVTLNDPAYVEAAQALGRRMASREGTIAEQLSHGFRLCLIREPSEAELNRLTKLFETVRANYQNDLAAAKTFAEAPLGPLPEGADPAAMAAWTLVGNVLLNLDEVLMKP